MDDYFKETSFILESLYFYYHGNRYQGKGIMTWKPDEGFHLEAFLDEQGTPIERIDLGQVRITSSSDICSIRMRPQGYDWAVAPDIILNSWDELSIQNKHLSINFRRTIFCESVRPKSDESLWTGSALYETKSKLSLADKVHTETRINEQEMGRKWEASGILYEDSQQRRLVGHLIDDRKLKLDWELPKELWSKAEAWKWAIAIQDVLSILFGETIRLLQREFLRDTQKITEIRQKFELSSLGLLSPFGNSQFNNQIFVKLTDFFIRSPSKAEVCRNIFRQLVESYNQHSQQAQELLLSTILEAALRTIDIRPFTVKKDKSWNVGKGLENFFNTYLPSNEWAEIRSQVMREHCYLRDRNAHPDWLFSQGGSLSESEQARALNSMILLSRFYGYMILAIAGFEGLQPDFPAPHEKWNSAATIEVVADPNSATTFPGFAIFGDMSETFELSDRLSKARTRHERTTLWRRFMRNN